MDTKALGRLTAVELRNVFTNEAGEFTPWLAQEENLALLSDSIGITLQLQAQEKDVGPFRADILCKDTATDQWVLVENQIERTDHTHLGQLLTYAAGLEAVTIVWIAQKFTDEHRAALDWLNEHTDEHINFFGLEMELWRIGDSPVAPKFNVVCQPNDWSRTVKTKAAQGWESSDLNKLQLRFWTAFREYMQANHSMVRCQKPAEQQWMNHAIGRSGYVLASIISTWNSATNSYSSPETRVEFAIMSDHPKEDFAALERKRQEIDRAIGAPVTWHNPSGKKNCKIYVRRDADFRNEALWPEQHQWLKDNLELFYKVFSPLVRSLDSEQPAQAVPKDAQAMGPASGSQN